MPFEIYSPLLQLRLRGEVEGVEAEVTSQSAIEVLWCRVTYDNCKIPNVDLLFRLVSVGRY